MGNSLSRRPWIYFSAFALFAAALWFVPRHIAVTVTPSLKYKVFFLKKTSEKEIRKGDYVLFTLSHPLLNEYKFRSAIKEVVCAGGDWLTVQGREYYCNGVRLGRAKEMSLKGTRVDNFRYDGIVPAGSLFIMGHTIDSLDSRYFGFIGVGDVTKMAYPLF